MFVEPYVEQLKRQMAEMMKALEREKSRDQHAKENLVSAGKRGTTNPAPQPLETPTRGPKIGTLDKFDVTRGSQAKTYVVQMVLCIAANPLMFPNNQSFLQSCT
ncbi:uncharacterized protein VP01_608g8 [Puccinia sorghi]|uniref:Uncharacterized protein n=1 Tax=Puccinia sorghi TaxID=27349 RepID=A0A0L6UH75_9BASI|nr:uncharacterized protein VP01_608g8 [Puccinia sorghi]